MGACEPGQARDRAAISGNFHVPGFSLKAVFFRSCARRPPPTRPFSADFGRRRSCEPSFLLFRVRFSSPLRLLISLVFLFSLI